MSMTICELCIKSVIQIKIILIFIIVNCEKYCIPVIIDPKLVID